MMIVQPKLPGETQQTPLSLYGPITVSLYLSNLTFSLVPYNLDGPSENFMLKLFIEKVKRHFKSIFYYFHDVCTELTKFLGIWYLVKRVNKAIICFSKR